MLLCLKKWFFITQLGDFRVHKLENFNGCQLQEAQSPLAFVFLHTMKLSLLAGTLSFETMFPCLFEGKAGNELPQNAIWITTTTVHIPAVWLWKKITVIFKIFIESQNPRIIEPLRVGRDLGCKVKFGKLSPKIPQPEESQKQVYLNPTCPSVQ